MVRFVATSTVLICFALPTQAGAQILFFGRKQTVETVNVKQVRQLLGSQASAEAKALAEKKEKPRADFVLVDVRSAEEQSVSMIPGAITAKQFEKHRDDHRGKTVIAYCTIGVRSEDHARKLISSGQTALNFKESILGWCEAKFSLVTPDGKPTKRVHTYSARYKVSKRICPTSSRFIPSRGGSATRPRSRAITIYPFGTLISRKPSMMGWVNRWGSDCVKRVKLSRKRSQRILRRPRKN